MLCPFKLSNPHLTTVEYNSTSTSKVLDCEQDKCPMWYPKDISQAEECSLGAIGGGLYAMNDLLSDIADTLANRE